MRAATTYLRFLTMALAVIAGVLSSSGTASASSQAPAPRSCCKKQACSACCCVPATTAPDRTAAVSTWTDRATSPLNSCECNPRVPAVPSHEQESTSGASFQVDPIEADLGTTQINCPRRRIAPRNVSSGVRLPGLALYLRLARLLF